MNAQEQGPEIVAAAAASAAASKATYGGAGVAVLSGLLTNEVGIAVGMLVGVIGLAAQIYYRRKEYLLKKRESEFRMRQAGATTGDFE